MREDNCVPETSQAILKILKEEFHSIPWEIMIISEPTGRNQQKTDQMVVKFDYRRNTDTK